MKTILILLCFCLLIPIKLFADGGSGRLPLVKKLVIPSHDSTITVHVRLSSKELGTLDKDLTYYWEIDQTIYHNQGAVSVNVLHGAYTVTNRKGQLVANGDFHNGLKDGEWKRWDTEGLLSLAEYWERGRLKQQDSYRNGLCIEHIYYNKKGTPKKKVRLINGSKATFTHKGGQWLEQSRLFKGKKPTQALSDSLASQPAK